jgi:hypothetical protein
MSRQRLQLTIFAAGLVLCGAMASAAAAGVTTRPRADETFEVIKTERFEGVIVPRERAVEFMKGFSGVEEKGAWTPGKDEVLKLEGKLESYLKKAAAKRSPNLWSKLAAYKRQYVGITRNGRRVIFANFFCNAFDVDWKTKPVSVSDGGDCYFTVLYDPGPAAFSDLQINGEA